MNLGHHHGILLSIRMVERGCHQRRQRSGKQQLVGHSLGLLGLMMMTILDRINHNRILLMIIPHDFAIGKVRHFGRPIVIGDLHAAAAAWCFGSIPIVVVVVVHDVHGTTVPSPIVKADLDAQSRYDVLDESLRRP